MKTDNELKDIVKETYSKAVNQSKQENSSSCCGAGSCSTEVYTIMSDEYANIDGYNPDADLGLGCGIPTAFAQIKEGQTVVDLGSGAGNDCFVARKLVGSTGKVIGIDFTEAMVEKARENADKLGFNNIEFRLGDIEHMPITANKADVIISNCVLNLVPNKKAVFNEIFRVLKPGGHFSISDIVLNNELPQNIKSAAAMYAGCIASAILKPAYMQLIFDAGFENISIQKEKNIIVPDDILANYLTQEEITDFKKNNTAIQSITVYAQKPDVALCCAPGQDCF